MMKYSEKLDIIINLYLHGEIDKIDYIRLRKSIEPTTIKLHGIIRDMRKEDK